MIYKFLTKVVFIATFLFSSQIFAVTASDIENANPEGQTVEFWVQYSDERLLIVSYILGCDTDFNPQNQ